MFFDWLKNYWYIPTILAIIAFFALGLYGYKRYKNKGKPKSLLEQEQEEEIRRLQEESRNKQELQEKLLEQRDVIKDLYGGYYDEEKESLLKNNEQCLRDLDSDFGDYQTILDKYNSINEAIERIEPKSEPNDESIPHTILDDPLLPSIIENPVVQEPEEISIDTILKDAFNRVGEAYIPIHPENPDNTQNRINQKITQLSEEVKQTGVKYIAQNEALTQPQKEWILENIGGQETVNGFKALYEDAIHQKKMIEDLASQIGRDAVAFNPDHISKTQIETEHLRSLDPLKHPDNNAYIGQMMDLWRNQKKTLKLQQNLLDQLTKAEQVGNIELHRKIQNLIEKSKMLNPYDFDNFEHEMTKIDVNSLIEHLKDEIAKDKWGDQYSTRNEEARNDIKTLSDIDLKDSSLVAQVKQEIEQKRVLRDELRKLEDLEVNPVKRKEYIELETLEYPINEKIIPLQQKQLEKQEIEIDNLQAETGNSSQLRQMQSANQQNSNQLANVGSENPLKAIKTEGTIERGIAQLNLQEAQFEKSQNIPMDPNAQRIVKTQEEKNKLTEDNKLPENEHEVKHENMPIDK